VAFTTSLCPPIVTPIASVENVVGIGKAVTQTSDEISDNWELVKVKDGVKLYTRPYANSDLKQVRAVTTLRTTLGGMITLLKDTKAAPLWMDRIEKYESIKTVSRNEWYIHAEIDIPWPFANTDVVTHCLLTQDKQSKKVNIAIKNVPQYIPAQVGVTRMQHSEGCWRLTPMSDNQIEAEYIVFAKPNSVPLPSWLINSIALQSIGHSISKMRGIVESENYRNLKLEYIHE
jgi:hypothetical protein